MGPTVPDRFTSHALGPGARPWQVCSASAPATISITRLTRNGARISRTGEERSQTAALLRSAMRFESAIESGNILGGSENPVGSSIVETDFEIRRCVPQKADVRGGESVVPSPSND